MLLAAFFITTVTKKRAPYFGGKKRMYALFAGWGHRICFIELNLSPR
jgi:hypothetical protein